MKLLWYCMFVGISASSIGMHLFGDIQMQEIDKKQITAIDWVNLIDQMRDGKFLDHTLKKFGNAFKNGNNFIELPQKVACYDYFKKLGIDLNNQEHDKLKRVMQTLVMHTVHDNAQREVERAIHWKEQQQDSYKLLWSQLAGNVAAPAAE